MSEIRMSQIETTISCSFKFIRKVGVEESIVIAPRITDQLFNVTLLFAFFVTDEWCVHNRLFNANFVMNT
jgi:hypothetical protein